VLAKEATFQHHLDEERLGSLLLLAGKRKMAERCHAADLDFLSGVPGGITPAFLDQRPCSHQVRCDVAAFVFADRC